MSKFSEVLADIGHGEKLDLEDVETVDQGASGEEPGSEAQEPESKQEEPTGDAAPDQEPEGETGEPGADADTGEPEEKPEEPEEPEDGESKDDDEPTFNIDGKEVSLSQLRKWRQEGLGQEDYTKKTMELAEQRKKLLARESDVSSLADDIAKDTALQQFLSARPEALGYLFKNPDATRALIGNAKAVEDFWSDYDVLVKNPRLAKNLVEAPNEAEQALQVEKENEAVVNMVNHLDRAIDVIGEKYYPDVDVEAVKQYVVDLSGLAGDTREEKLAAAAKIWTLFFEQKDGETTINPRLLQSEFERIKAAGAPEKPPAKDPVEAHNEAVDEKLKETQRPPKTPSGSAPVTGEKTVKYDSFRGVIDDILSPSD